MSLPDPASEPTVSIERAGNVLGLGRTAAYSAATAGDLPTIQVGTRRRVPTAALLQLLGQTPAVEPGTAALAAQYDAAADRLAAACTELAGAITRVQVELKTAAALCPTPPPVVRLVR